jgi:hypothetical protein
MLGTRRTFVLGGIIASHVLIAFGVGAIAMGVHGRNEVRTSIAQEKIVGTPGSSIAGDKVDTGSEAKTFAKVIRKDTLAITKNRTYAEMGRFLTADGTETSDASKAAIDPQTKAPVANHSRDIWVTSTALSTALNTAYFGEQVALFAIIVGIALLLTGIGFVVLTIGALRIPAQQLVAVPVMEAAVA